jgi:hypothetical protein
MHAFLHMLTESCSRAQRVVYTYVTKDVGGNVAENVEMCVGLNFNSPPPQKRKKRSLLNLV